MLWPSHKKQRGFILQTLGSSARDGQALFDGFSRVSPWPCLQPRAGHVQSLKGTPIHLKLHLFLLLFVSTWFLQYWLLVLHWDFNWVFWVQMLLDALLVCLTINSFILLGWWSKLTVCVCVFSFSFFYHVLFILQFILFYFLLSVNELSFTYWLLRLLEVNKVKCIMYIGWHHPDSIASCFIF